ncbi:MAG: diguanylate cyclase [Burkholderiales bacterium]|nr:diguanylate cyclase [Burkholderiales bacterium]
MPDTLHLSPAEAAQRKAFLEFGEKDVVRLKDLHALLAGQASFFVEAFYAHLLAFEETQRLIQDGAKLEGLKKAQAAYFDQLTAGEYGDAYIQNRIRVGIAHRRVGLDPKWYLGAYNKYLALLLPKVGSLLGEDAGKTLETTLALLRIIFLDMGIAIDTYIDADRQAIRNKTEQLEALNQVAIAISSSLGLQEVLDRIMRSGIALSVSKAACIAFYSEESQRFEEWHTQGLSAHFIKNMSFSPGGLADETFTSESHVVSNDRPETRHKLSKLARDEGILGFICLPLISHTRRLGVLYLYRHDRDTFLPEEVNLLTTFAHLAAGALENARLHAQTLSLATTDTLTSLLNRRALDERLHGEMQRSRRYGKSFSILMLDIDHFKKVNDSYGHPAGDAVLKQLAAILKKQARDVDSVARYGGEEFVIVAPELDGSSAQLVGERIRKAVAGTAFILPDGREIGVTVSIGIACFPRCADSAEAMIERADQALYLAKREGRNRVYLYRELLHAELEKSPGRIAELLNQDIENAKAIATAVNVKTAYLRDHADRVEAFAMKLGRRLHLAKAELKLLRHASILHDLGYLSVPVSIVNKREPFTPQEWDIIKQHPVAASEMLKEVPALQDAMPLIRHHHEWVDGNGYPDGLKGEAIPYLARILSVVDAYSAMTSDRPQRRAMKPYEARALIAAGAGKQFDAHIVAEFIRMLEGAQADSFKGDA